MITAFGWNNSEGRSVRLVGEPEQFYLFFLTLMKQVTEGPTWNCYEAAEAAFSDREAYFIGSNVLDTVDGGSSFGRCGFFDCDNVDKDMVLSRMQSLMAVAQDISARKRRYGDADYWFDINQWCFIEEVMYSELDVTHWHIPPDNDFSCLSDYPIYHNKHADK